MKTDYALLTKAPGYRPSGFRGGFYSDLNLWDVKATKEYFGINGVSVF